MTQASNRRQEEAKEGWVKAGPRVSTQERSEGIISHTGEAPCWWPGNLQRRSFFPPFHRPLRYRLRRERLPNSANVQTRVVPPLLVIGGTVGSNRTTALGGS